MITPALNCPSFTYQIINMSGGVEVDTNLAELNGSVYYFNFTLPEGDYIIRLCDNTTREVRVVDAGDNMIPGVIILIPLILGIIMIIASLGIGEEHPVLRWFLFLGSFVLSFVSLQLGSLAIAKFYNWSQMQTTIGTTTYVVVTLFSLVVIYLIIYLFYKGFRMAGQEKNEKLEY
jgi:Ca2+/Na+ antiporter